MSTPLMVFAAAELDDHRPPPGHPEHRGRLDAALEGISAANLDDATEWRVPDMAAVADLEAVHEHRYVELVENLCSNGGGRLDADTAASSGSWGTARRSTGAVLEAIDALDSGECDVAFAAGRPPGHHAEPDRAMGFCLFNNIAVGAAKLAARGQKVAIVDWDVHHGNGTQDMFYDDPNVLYISTHQSPLYPGTGQLDETGAGAGAGTNVNVPFPSGTGGDAFRAAFDDVVTPVVEGFQPDWLLISAGFDAHRNDPLAGLQLTGGDYADLATRLQALVPARRLLVVLEGGYDPDALTVSVGSTLSALVEGAYRPEPASSGEIGMQTVEAARRLWEVL